MSQTITVRNRERQRQILGAAFATFISEAPSRGDVMSDFDHEEIQDDLSDFGNIAGVQQRREQLNEQRQIKDLLEKRKENRNASRDSLND